MNTFFRACRFLVFAALLIAVGGAQAQAQQTENTNIASVTPTVVIPFFQSPPTLDGAIAPGEWNTMHVSRLVSGSGDLLSARRGEFWIGSDRKNLYIAIRSAVHPKGGIVALQKPRGNADMEVVFDDSIEMWIDNNPGASDGQYFQIMANSLGALFDARFEHSEKIAQKYWRVNMKQAHKVEGGLWTAEFAIPLADVGITDATKPLAIRIARNFKSPWDQARWEPRVLAFDVAETMGKVRFSDSAPIVDELDVQDAEGINIGVKISNPTTQPMKLRVRLGYNAQDQPRYYQDTEATLAPGAAQKFEYKKPFFTPDNYPAIGDILVTNSAGETFYHRDFKWQTKPDMAKVWDVIETANATEATDFDIAYMPSYKLLRWRAAFHKLKGREAIKRLRLQIARVGDKKPAAQMTVAPKNFATEARLALPALADGTYQVNLFLDGAKPAIKPSRTTTFFHQNNFPWKNNRIGFSDEVIPPFTPITVKGNTVGTIGRQHGMTQSGLWSQVRSIGREILASPMRFEVRQGSKIQSVRAHLSMPSRRASRVTSMSDWTAGSLRGRTQGEFDIDGVMKVTLDLSQAKGAAKIDGLDLVIPIRDDIATLMHACGEGLRSNYGGAIPRGQGVIWTSKTGSRDKLIGTFLPYLFVGGEERGLVWFASNDRDWIVDTTDKTPALSLERHGRVLALRVRLIQKPATLSRTHRIVFGLQATPVKPMPQNPDWRVRGFLSGGKFETVLLGMSYYWGSDLYGVFPRNRDFTVVQKIAQARKTGQIDAPFFDNYVKANPDIRAEINVAFNGRSDAVIPYTNLRGEVTDTPEWLMYQDEWQRYNFGPRRTKLTKESVDFVAIPARSRQDYLMYYYRELLRNGFDGIYWDNIAIYDNENPVTGNAYVREDGAFQSDTDIWELRELTRRVAVMSYKMGRRNLGMPHMTNAYLIPVFGWSTINLDWEWRYGGSDFQDRFTREYSRAASLGRQGGNIPVILPGIVGVDDLVKRAWVERTRIAVTVPHEMNIWSANDALFQSIRAHFYTLGYGTPDCKVFNYWDGKPVAKVTGLDAAWLVLENKDSVALFVSDYGNGGAAQVKLDVKRLGLPPDFTAANWEKTDETVVARAGVLALPEIKKHDFRLWTIRKTQAN